MLSIPLKIDIPDTPDLSILRFDAICDEKSKMAAHQRQLSTAETQSTVSFDWNQLETECLCLSRGYDCPQ